MPFNPESVWISMKAALRRLRHFETKGSRVAGPVSKIVWTSVILMLLSLTRETMVYHLKAVDEEEALDKLQQFNLRGVAEKVECPLLVIQGRRDRLVPAEQGERIAAEAGSAAEFWMFEDGNHVCNNIPYKHRPQQSDWMRQKLYGGV